VGCCALHISWDDLAEIKSLAVRKDQQSKGIGSQLVSACLSEARELGAAKVFVLTYQPSFLHNSVSRKSAMMPCRIRSGQNVSIARNSPIVRKFLY